MAEKLHTDTVPGGRYIVNGKTVDANGQEIEKQKTSKTVEVSETAETDEPKGKDKK